MKSDTTETIYRAICESCGLSVCDIAKKVDMDDGKVENCLSRLEKMGLVEFKFEEDTNGVQKVTYPVKVPDLLPKSLRSKLNSL